LESSWKGEAYDLPLLRRDTLIDGNPLRRRQI
jgi:hypothetical protein